MTPAFASSSLKVVATTDTLSNTWCVHRHAVLRLDAGEDLDCSRRGMPSFS